MTATALERRVPTDTLKSGDVVLIYGLRVEISEPEIWTQRYHGREEQAFAFPGRILNPEHLAVNKDMFHGVVAPDATTYTVQGRWCAGWVVERPGRCPSIYGGLMPYLCDQEPDHEGLHRHSPTYRTRLADGSYGPPSVSEHVVWWETAQEEPVSRGRHAA